MADRSAYRDELSAAQARVAALEEALAARSPDADRHRQIVELEAERRRALDSADPRRIRKASALVGGGIFLLLAIPFVVVSIAYSHVALLGALAIVAVPALLLGLLSPLIFRSGAKSMLASVDKRLEEARRFRDLEEQVKETRDLVEQMARRERRLRIEEPIHGAARSSPSPIEEAAIPEEESPELPQKRRAR